jgi:hypothetical protein
MKTLLLKSEVTMPISNTIEQIEMLEGLFCEFELLKLEKDLKNGFITFEFTYEKETN